MRGFKLNRVALRLCSHDPHIIQDNIEHKTIDLGIKYTNFHFST